MVQLRVSHLILSNGQNTRIYFPKSRLEEKEATALLLDAILQFIRYMSIEELLYSMTYNTL